MPDKSQALWHQSGVNKKGDPFVQLILHGKVIAQMNPRECREHARACTEAAEAAETDAFLMAWAQTVVGVPFDKAGSMLLEFRKFREDMFGKKYGAQHSKDWVMPTEDKTQ